jgi:hypothetical protein
VENKGNIRLADYDKKGVEAIQRALDYLPAAGNNLFASSRPSN